MKPGEINFDKGLLEEDVRELYEEAPCGFLSMLPDGKIVKVNRTFLRWTGYEPAELTWARRFQDILPVVGKIYYDTHFAPLLLMQRQVNEITFDILCRDGKRLPVFLNASLKTDETGKPLIIRATLLDARQRRSYELELLEAKRKVEKAEAELRKANESLEKRVVEQAAERERMWRTAQDILAIGSIDGRFISCNPAFTRLLGWTESEIRSTSFADLVFSEDFEAFSDNMKKLSRGEPILQNIVRRRHKFGGYRWISWNIVPEDHLLYFVGRDVTAEVEQREVLRSTEKALFQAQKMEAIGQLTGGMAHDFNNLLAGISGNLQLMRIRLERGQVELLPQYINQAEAITDKAAVITNRLLSYARQQTLVFRMVNANRLIDSMKDLFRQAVTPNVQLHVDLSVNELTVHIDANQFENALLNLVINAKDAMPEGGEINIRTDRVFLESPLRLMGQSVSSGNYATISVSDTGTGMTPEVLSKVLEPFFTTKGEGRGTGLGLPMVSGFVQQSGGHIDIQSEPEAGTTVILYLPAYQITCEKGQEDAVKAVPLRHARHARVLLVDDDEPLRAVMAEFLKEDGYTVFQAADAPQALEILRLQEQAQQIELLITDVGLPGKMNGKQLADMAATLAPELKILFISGYVQDEKTRAAFSLGDEQILNKPFPLETLLNAAQSLLESRH